jgi:D-alanyl-D-alanine carboxypeptidase
MPGTSAYLNSNNRISIYDCLCAMMIPSGNDAAVVLATEFGRWLFLIGDKQKESQLSFLQS